MYKFGHYAFQYQQDAFLFIEPKNIKQYKGEVIYAIEYNERKLYFFVVTLEDLGLFYLKLQPIDRTFMR